MKAMTVERALLAFAGSMVLVSVLLTCWLHANFVWFTVFIGANMLQSAFTGFCPAVWVLKKLGLPTEAEQAGSCGR